MLPPIVPALEGRLKRSPLKVEPLIGWRVDERLDYTALALADEVQLAARQRVLSVFMTQDSAQLAP
jgi:hypothetical protein